MSMENANKKRSLITPRMLAESGIMLALGFVLSWIAPFKLPFGGSVTLCCMLPVIIIGYRYGISWGCLSGFVFGLLQIVQDPSPLKGMTALSFVASLVLDYFLAFGVLGLSSIFKRMKGVGFPIGVLFVTLLRYVCHIISGATVFGIYAEGKNPWIYSIGYNATYMVPEIILTTVVAAILICIKPVRAKLDEKIL